MLENKVKGMLGTQWEEVAGEVIILYIDDLQKCYFSPNVIMAIKPSRTRRAGQAAGELNTFEGLSVPETVTSYSRLRRLYKGKMKIDLQEESSKLLSNDSRYGALMKTIKVSGCYNSWGNSCLLTVIEGNTLDTADMETETSKPYIFQTYNTMWQKMA